MCSPVLRSARGAPCSPARSGPPGPSRTCCPRCCATTRPVPASPRIPRRSDDRSDRSAGHPGCGRAPPPGRGAAHGQRDRRRRRGRGGIPGGAAQEHSRRHGQGPPAAPVGQERPRHRGARRGRDADPHRRQRAVLGGHRVCGLLYGRVECVPHQRRDGRRGGPRAPHQAVPAHRRGGAAGRPRLRHGSGAHRRLDRHIPAVHPPGPGERRGSVHRAAAHVLLRPQAPAGARHRVCLLRLPAACRGRRRGGRGGDLPMVPAGHGVRLLVHGGRETLRRAESAPEDRRQDPQGAGELHPHLPAIRVDPVGHGARTLLRPVGLRPRLRPRAAGRRGDLAADLDRAVHHRGPAVRRGRRRRPGRGAGGHRPGRPSPAGPRRAVGADRRGRRLRRTLRRLSGRGAMSEVTGRRSAAGHRPASDPWWSAARRWSQPVFWTGLVLSAALFLAGAWQRRWIADDGLIVLRTVRNLIAGNGPVFNAGERVESNTSTLWTYLIYFTHEVVGYRLELVALGPALTLSTAAVVCAMLGARVMYQGTRRAPAGRGPMLLLPFGVLAYIMLPPARDFATSGLETGLVIWWIGVLWLGMQLWARSPHREGRFGLPTPATAVLAFLAGLGPLVRPEMALVAVVVLGLMALARQSWRHLGWLVVLAGTVPVVYQIWRMSYYALPYPLTAVAKDAGGAKWDKGVLYLWDLLEPYTLLLPLILVLVAGLTCLWLLTGGGDPLRRLARAGSDPLRRPSHAAADDDEVGRVLRLRERVRSTPVVTAAFFVVAVVMLLYVTRVGGDFMHGRVL